MTEPITVSGQQVTVVRDGRIRAAGLRQDGVVAYDWGFTQHGRDYAQRSFVLLDDGIQINQPVAFPPQQQGWWYCDLVTVVDDGEVLRVDDMWIDVIIGPPDHPYRLLDLDDYGQAMHDGRLSPSAAVDGLKRAQRFLDRRLNRRHEVERTWPAFPPAEVETLLHVALPQDWTLQD
ncbi:MAG: DUF402 domain-containing protein [Catenulisporales bacterium]|jgi:hypothetical protein|nr:DUF402 domain-containing protein [Catenulisporales bacterium]